MTENVEPCYRMLAARIESIRETLGVTSSGAYASSKVSRDVYCISRIENATR